MRGVATCVPLRALLSAHVDSPCPYVPRDVVCDGATSFGVQVLDQLELDGIAKQTLVFFSGDNGPDGHNFELFDDPGIFRGKKRSLHEGGIRQTILAYWPGTIAAGVSQPVITEERMQLN